MEKMLKNCVMVIILFDWYKDEIIKRYIETKIKVYTSWTSYV